MQVLQRRAPTEQQWAAEGVLSKRQVPQQGLGEDIKEKPSADER